MLQWLTKKANNVTVLFCTNVNIIKNQESLQLNSEYITGIHRFLPDHAFTAGQLIYQEGQDRGFLSRRVSLKGFGP